VCGIFGIVSKGGSDFVRELTRLFILSESRGKEAAGVAIFDGNEITVLKEPRAASHMIRTEAYRSLLDERIKGNVKQSIAAIGHSRLVTNGRSALAANNQPVIRDNAVCVHNGIIVNDAKIWIDHPDLSRHAEVDTEALLALFGKFRRDGYEISTAIAQVFREIEGTASIAILIADEPKVLLATNNGSLYFTQSDQSGRLHFASERHILQRLIETTSFGGDAPPIHAVCSGQGVLIDIATGAARVFDFVEERPLSRGLAPQWAPAVVPRIRDLTEADDPRRANLRRCTKCIMPGTMPFIEFDGDGVCNYCRTYVPHKPLGLDALRELVAPFRSRKKDQPDCLVAVSGGRDSCYGLHVLKAELGLNPVAYTYDWGMITDLARRNQARLCGKLGVEHILVSADIPKKREYVRHNVEAWLRRPTLGMIPLFMAGDKQYFHYANRIQRQLGVELSFLCENILERAHFKSGFMGVEEGHKRVYNVSFAKKMTVLRYHIIQYALNPRYINKSLFDTLFAFHSSYLLKHDNIQLYDYANWQEDEVVGVLRREYDWELATDTTSTWRIGDGTAAFYNYIYYNVAGFTENDALRSNQIRQGVMTRERALELVQQENEPRWDSLQWYANTIGFSLNDALQVISGMPRLWRTSNDRLATSTSRMGARLPQFEAAE
jgi:glucosamine--fructose-6-phosphate aminotransferase (isomerizing)